MSEKSWQDQLRQAQKELGIGSREQSSHKSPKETKRTHAPIVSSCNGPSQSRKDRPPDPDLIETLIKAARFSRIALIDPKDRDLDKFLALLDRSHKQGKISECDRLLALYSYEQAEYSDSNRSQPCLKQYRFRYVLANASAKIIVGIEKKDRSLAENDKVIIDRILSEVSQWFDKNGLMNELNTAIHVARINIIEKNLKKSENPLKNRVSLEASIKVDNERERQHRLKVKLFNDRALEILASWSRLQKQTNPVIRHTPHFKNLDIKLALSWYRGDAEKRSAIQSTTDDETRFPQIYDRDQELMRVLSARAAEKAALLFYSRCRLAVEDISIKQILESENNDWKFYDLKVDGRLVDVKNSRRSKDKMSQNRYVTHLVPKFKKSDN